MGTIVLAVILGVIAIGSFIVSCLQFKEKGLLFNNAYIYASKQERDAMDKKPHYKQSGVIFLLGGIIFLIDAIDVILKTDWLFYCVTALVVIAIVYAVISSVMIAKRNTKS